MARSKDNALVIFISHASSDAECATAIQHELRRVFRKGVEVFCTSSPEAIPVGREWLSDIGEHLKTARALVVLITPASIEKSWLWFEIGAIWSKGAPGEYPIYPLCTLEVDRLDLPSPLDRLQATWIGNAANCRSFIDALVTQFGFGNPSSLRPANILKKIRVYRREDVSEFESHEVYGFGPAHYAWKIISGYRSLHLTDCEGESLANASDKIPFELLARLVLLLLSIDRPDDGFTDEFVYMRLWKALQHVSRGSGVIRYQGLDFVNHMEVLRATDVVGHEYGAWHLTWLGRQLLDRWPKRITDQSDDEILEILNASEEFESPTLEEAEDALPG